MLIFLSVVVIILILFVSWLQLFLDKKRTSVQGPTHFPIIGNGYKLAVETTELLNVFKELQDEHNKNVLIYLFSQRYILTSDPRFIEDIVSSTRLIIKGSSYDYIKPWLGQGLLTSSGARWKAHRKFLTPAFHFSILQNFLPIFCKNGKILVKKLRKHADGSTFDVMPFIALAALDNVTESIMGVSVNAQNDSESSFVKAVCDISSIAAMRMRNIFVAPDVIFNLLPYKTTQDKALKVLHGKTKEVINARREQLKKSNFNFDSTTNKHAFLDLLLYAEVDGKKISDECIREEVDTFMFEGHDTTMSGITFCIYCLSNNQDIQDKVFEEQVAIFGDDLDKDPTYNDVQQMKYLELVIKESLRLFPSVPLIERHVQEDTVLNGLCVPKDTSIVIDFFNMQRNPENYKDPLAFIPERFENTTRNPFTWLPFSAGPRNCIGQKFAMLELKSTVSEIVRHFKVLPSGEEPQLSTDLVLRSRNGVKVKMIPRRK